MPRCINGFVSLLCVALTAVALHGQPANGAAKDSPEAAAKRIEQTLEELEKRSEDGTGAGRSYEMTESDLNAYLKAKLKERNRRDVESLTVNMGDGAFVTYLTIDFDHVEVKGDSASAQLFKFFLRGKQTIEVEGRLKTEKGKGAYEVQRATLNGMPLPASLVNAILSTVGRRQDPPFDPTEPFDLPYGIQTIEVQEDKTILRT